MGERRGERCGGLVAVRVEVAGERLELPARPDVDVAVVVVVVVVFDGERVVLRRRRSLRDADNGVHADVDLVAVLAGVRVGVGERREGGAAEVGEGCGGAGEFAGGRRERDLAVGDVGSDAEGVGGYVGGEDGVERRRWGYGVSVVVGERDGSEGAGPLRGGFVPARLEDGVLGVCAEIPGVVGHAVAVNVVGVPRRVEVAGGDGVGGWRLQGGGGLSRAG